MQQRLGIILPAVLAVVLVVLARRRGCPGRTTPQPADTHAADAPDCALDEWLAGLAPGSAELAVAEARVDSVRRLLAALSERTVGA